MLTTKQIETIALDLVAQGETTSFGAGFVEGAKWAVKHNADKKQKTYSKEEVEQIEKSMSVRIETAKEIMRLENRIKELEQEYKQACNLI